MNIDAANAQLQQVRVDHISANPDNPRIHFRQKEMDDLMESIALRGVQVPVSVYREGKKFILIDGERRWRCAIKLNLKTIPALIQDEPDKLTNLLLMFNIHALREQWDLLTIALKLAVVIDLLEAQLGKRPTEVQIARETGLTRGVIRRCRLLLNLPDEFKDQLQGELRKPKREQRLTEDFFIEMERALTTVERAMPSAVPDKSRVRRVLIEKFKSGVIDNRTHFRNVAKIARAAKVEANVEAAEASLKRLFVRNKYSIQDAYEETVAGAYSERDIATRLDGLVARLEHLKADEVDLELRRKLRRLIKIVRRLLGR